MRWLPCNLLSGNRYYNNSPIYIYRVLRFKLGVFPFIHDTVGNFLVTVSVCLVKGGNLPLFSTLVEVEDVVDFIDWLDIA